MTLVRRALLLGILSLGFSATSVAQVTTGTPPFGAFGGGPADTINLGNLNVHIDIPVLQKAGRGVPFNYDITYDTSLWAPPSVTGGSTWQPFGPPNWSFGWFFPVQGGVQEIVTGESFCGSPYPSGGSIGFGFIYYDPLGTPHPLPGALVYTWGTCGTNSYYWYGGGPATDGSGYVLSGDSSGNIKVTAKDGNVVYWTNSQNNYVQPVATDANGNEITVDTSDSVFTDTLGGTALTLGGSGTPSSPKTFTYTAPSGANAVYTLKYTAYTVKTNFGCSGISEYGPTAQNLPSELDLPDGSKYTFTYESTPGYSGDVTARLASVKLPTDGTIYYTYSGTHDGIACADGSTSGLTRQTPDGTWTYSRAANGVTTITDPQSNETVMNFVGIYPTETQVYQGSSSSGTLLKTTVVCYNGSTPSGYPATCNSANITLPIAQKTTYTEWPGATVLESKTNTLYNSYGLPTEFDEYGYGSGAPGSLVRKTLTAYASLGNNIVDRPSSVTVCSGSGTAAACNNAGTVMAQTTYAYDQGSVATTSGTPQHISVSGSRGNVTTVSYLVSGSTTLTKTFTYYDTGNVQTATDVNGAQTSYTYGACGNSFPTQITEPIGSMTKSMTWNCTGGVITSVTDENGKTVSTLYTDPYFWRPNSITDQLLNATNLTYNGQTSVEGSLNFASSTSDVLATVDGLGRSHISQVRQGPGSGTYDSVETDYDSLGRPNRTTLPYAATANQQCSGNCPATTTSYDALGRPTSVTDGGNGTTSYSYTQNDTYVTAGPAPTGENTKRRQLEYDALGRLTSVCEITGATGSGTCAQTTSATGYWTTYSYDANNNLTGVMQNAQSGSTQTRTFGYDDLGRMTSETNPESGTTTYTFDTDATCGTSNGDLVKKVDALGNTTCFAYDALHRPTSATYPSGSYAAITPKKYFVYDSATVNSVVMVNAKTRVAEAYTCFSPCTTKLTDIGFSYTARGEVSDVYESTPHSGGYYHVNETYWANGAVNQLNGGTNPLPGLPTITYGLDGEGRLNFATASTGQNPLTGTGYISGSGLLGAVTFGSGDGDTFNYDPNTNRMTGYSFYVNGQYVTGNLAWNALGTLAQYWIADAFNSSNTQNCFYAHDDLVRITSANCGSIWSQTFSYDPFGNISKAGNPGYSFQPTYSTTNRMTSIGGSIPAYDPNGNVTNDFLHTYGWDADGKPNTIDGVGITYDALGRMVEQNRSGAYTEIVYAPSGAKLALMNGSALQKGFVSLTGGAMAVYNSSGLAYYRHSDWLGSSRLGSTPSRTVAYDVAYAPFGEPYAQTGASDLSFTGMNQDTVANLYDFPAREYGIQGRWPSPDPAGMAAVDPSDPQTWNRYVYVRNSPLNLTDPTGLCGEPPVQTGGYWSTDPTTGEPTYNFGVIESQPCDFWYLLRYFGYPVNWGMPGWHPSGGGGGGGGSPGTVTGPPCLAGVGPLAPGQSYCAANNGTPQIPTKTQERLERLKNCALGYYGIDPLSLSGATSNGAKWGLIALSAGGIPKSVASSLGLRVIMQPGASEYTSALSMLSLATGGGGALRTIANFGSKWAGPIAIASAVIDATAIGICTASD